MILMLLRPVENNHLDNRQISPATRATFYKGPEVRSSLQLIIIEILAGLVDAYLFSLSTSMGLGLDDLTNFQSIFNISDLRPMCLIESFSILMSTMYSYAHDMQMYTTHTMHN
jgi:hypothetical protein